MNTTKGKDSESDSDTGNVAVGISGIATRTSPGVGVSDLPRCRNHRSELPVAATTSTRKYLTRPNARSTLNGGNSGKEHAHHSIDKELEGFRRMYNIPTSDSDSDGVEDAFSHRHVAKSKTRPGPFLFHSERGGNADTNPNEDLAKLKTRLRKVEKENSYLFKEMAKLKSEIRSLRRDRREEGPVRKKAKTDTRERESVLVLGKSSTVKRSSMGNEEEQIQLGSIVLTSQTVLETVAHGSAEVSRFARNIKDAMDILEKRSEELRTAVELRDFMKRRSGGENHFMLEEKVKNLTEKRQQVLKSLKMLFSHLFSAATTMCGEIGEAGEKAMKETPEWLDKEVLDFLGRSFRIIEG